MKNITIYKRRIIYLLILFSILIAILIRIPNLIEGESGSDGLNYHRYINQIINDNSIDWVVNILSHFGFYPPYQETGSLIIYASLTLSSGINLSFNILIISIFFLILSMLSIFILTKEFTNSNRIALITTFILPMTRRMLAFTVWIIGNRIYSAIFVMLFILLLLLYLKKKNKSIIFLIIIVLMIGITLHRTAVIVFGLIIIIIPIIFFIKQKRIYWNKKYSIIIFWVVFIIIFIISNLRERGTFTIAELLPTLPSHLDIMYLGNMVYNNIFRWVMYIGLYFIFLPLGFIIYTLKNETSKTNTLFFYGIIILSIFSFGDPGYTGTFFLFTYIIVIAFGINYLIKYFIKMNKKFIIIAFVSFILITFSIMPSFITIEKSEIELNENTTNKMEMALFIKYSINEGEFIGTYGVDINYMLAYGNKPRYNDNQIEYIFNNTEPFNFNNLLNGYPFYFTYIDYLFELSLLNKDIDNSPIIEMIDKYNLEYLIINSHQGPKVKWAHMSLSEKNYFLDSITLKRYKIIENQSYIVYNI